MIKLFYKHTSTFYLNAEIYDHLSSSKADLTVKNLKSYFITKIKASHNFKLKLHKLKEKLHSVVFYTDSILDNDLLISFFNPQKELLPI